MTSPKTTVQQRSDLTDIRFIIASALGLIGIFLLICAAFVGTSPEELAKTGGINANLWSGAGLLIVAIVMGIWWKVDPTAGASAHSE